MTTIEDIREWLKRGKDQGASHMLVVCDTFDWEDYPVFVMPGENLAAKAREKHGSNMQKVMECYAVNEPWEPQLRQRRCWNGWNPLDKS